MTEIAMCLKCHKEQPSILHLGGNIAECLVCHFVSFDIAIALAVLEEWAVKFAVDAELPAPNLPMFYKDNVRMFIVEINDLKARLKKIKAPPLRSYGPTVTTPPCQGGNTGATPVSSAGETPDGTDTQNAL